MGITMAKQAIACVQHDSRQRGRRVNQDIACGVSPEVRGKSRMGRAKLFSQIPGAVYDCAGCASGSNQTLRRGMTQIKDALAQHDTTGRAIGRPSVR